MMEKDYPFPSIDDIFPLEVAHATPDEEAHTYRYDSPGLPIPHRRNVLKMIEELPDGIIVRVRYVDPDVPGLTVQHENERRIQAGLQPLSEADQMYIAHRLYIASQL